MTQIGLAVPPSLPTAPLGVPFKTLFIALALALGGAPAWAQDLPANVDGPRIIAADKEPGNWMSTGRTYDEQRYSPLNKISDQNVGKLGLAWSYKLDLDRGVEATPIVVDGVMYTTGPFSVVYALDARDGKLLWKYDPKSDRNRAGEACCDAVNRGVAVWKGKVYVGVLDGRLEAIDAKTGQRAWSVDTRADHKRSYTITGAPRVVNGKVVIGNGGAEFGVRGYVTAYDAETGKQAWRFFTVPGDPKLPPEDKAMEIAAKTWHGDAFVEQGGGGTAWDSFAFDPELNLLYIGVGNGSMWDPKWRSQAKGDNLFLSSIVAVNADTGEYARHYQTTPGDAWDYTATQHMILAELPIDGKPRKVLMQAPKNGFFYVIDRATGELLSAKGIVPQSWTKGMDMKTGRPILDEENAAYWKNGKRNLVTPAFWGAHDWQPMSYNPNTGLVYIPAHNHHRTIRHVVFGKAQPRYVALITVGTGENIDGAVTQGFHRLRPLGEAQYLHRCIQARADQAQVIGADALVAIAVAGDINRLIVINRDAHLQRSMRRQPLLLAGRQGHGLQGNERWHQLERQADSRKACRTLHKQQHTCQPHTRAGR